jgi:DNA-binding CsgD family transcriptional regulator
MGRAPTDREEGIAFLLANGHSPEDVARLYQCSIGFVQSVLAQFDVRSIARELASRSDKGPKEG